jgi:hypothetical protein
VLHLVGIYYSQAFISFRIRTIRDKKFHSLLSSHQNKAMKQMVLNSFGLAFILANVSLEAHVSNARQQEHTSIRRGRNLRKHREPKIVAVTHNLEQDAAANVGPDDNAGLGSQQGMLGRDLCQVLLDLDVDGVTCPAPPEAGNACPITQICGAGGTLALFCAIRAEGCEAKCKSAFQKCDGCTNIDCSADNTSATPLSSISLLPQGSASSTSGGGINGAAGARPPNGADGRSGRNVCTAIQNANGLCPAPPGMAEAKCPVHRICQFGGTLVKFCSAKASDCEADCLTAFSKCDECTSIDCSQQQPLASYQLPQAAPLITTQQGTGLAIANLVSAAGPQDVSSSATADGTTRPDRNICQLVQSSAASDISTCPAPPGRDAKCPIRQICQASGGGTLLEFCSSKAANCVEECITAFRNCDGCTDAETECTALPQQVTLGGHQAGLPAGNMAATVSLNKKASNNINNAIGVSSISPFGRKKAAIQVHCGYGPH